METSILAATWLSPELLLLLDQHGYLLGVRNGGSIQLYRLPDPRWSQAPAVAGFFDDIANAAKGAARGVYGAAKGAVSSVASFVHHPPGWLAAALPLFTSENQRYWAKTLGGSTGAQLYDTGVKAIATKTLGAQGPQLVEAYNKIVEDASQGHLDAKEILSRAPQIAKLAVASRQGPAAFKAAVAATSKSAPKVSGQDPSWYLGY